VVKVLSETDIRTALSDIKDPEIPTVSITDLGIVYEVRVAEDVIEITLLPTFAGCPALDIIREDVEKTVRGLVPGAEVRVAYGRDPAWTTGRLAPDAEIGLRAYGISAPGRVVCPYCGSEQTNEESAFGPTPCRSVRYCSACRNPFEAFKRKTDQQE